MNNTTISISESEKQYYCTEFLKYSTPSISDALDSLRISGGLVGIQQRGFQSDCVGFVFTIKFKPMNREEFHRADDYIEGVSKGDVIVIDNAGRDFCTVWGNILTEVAIRQGIAGTVVYGAVRDVGDIHDLKYALFSSHIFMQSGKARVQKEAQQCPVNLNGTIVNSGDLLRGDENGCVVIPRSQLKEVLKRSANITKTEEQILEGVRSGESLSKLREKYSYAKPWECVRAE